jgi:hypothetical protein
MRGAYGLRVYDPERHKRYFFPSFSVPVLITT